MANFHFQIDTSDASKRASSDTSPTNITAAKLLADSQQPVPFTKVADTSPGTALQLDEFSGGDESTPPQQRLLSHNPFASNPSGDYQSNSGIYNYADQTPLEAQQPKELHTGIKEELGLVAALGALALIPGSTRRVMTEMLVGGTKIAARNPKISIPVIGGLYAAHELGLDNLFE